VELPSVQVAAIGLQILEGVDAPRRDGIAHRATTLGSRVREHRYVSDEKLAILEHCAVFEVRAQNQLRISKMLGHEIERSAFG
jgi:hypothetical protein